MDNNFPNLTAAQWTRLLGDIHADESERAPDPPAILYKAVIIWSGANIRRQPAIGNNVIRTAKNAETFITEHTETTDIDGNRWIQIPDGFICTYYNRTLRATVTKI
jgi:hypothetical protein